MSEENNGYNLREVDTPASRELERVFGRCMLVDGVLNHPPETEKELINPATSQKLYIVPYLELDVPDEILGHAIVQQILKNTTPYVMVFSINVNPEKGRGEFILINKNELDNNPDAINNLRDTTKQGMVDGILESAKLLSQAKTALNKLTEKSGVTWNLGDIGTFGEGMYMTDQKLISTHEALVALKRIAGLKQKYLGFDPVRRRIFIAHINPQEVEAINSVGPEQKKLLNEAFEAQEIGTPEKTFKGI